jgi:predicted enzyme related to lactoylglutathione lyase
MAPSCSPDCEAESHGAPVKVLGISWAGVKTTEFDRSRDFFARVMGLTISYQKTDFAVLQLPDGDKLEIFGPHGPDPEQQFSNNSVVAGFWVEDFESAREELARGGAELVDEPGGETGGYRWQHFRAPDGKIFEICSDPLRASPG